MVHLHVHSHYSLLDGLSSPIELADRAIELGQPSIALTDHGNMFGAIDFYTACKERGIKPIIGYEAYVAPMDRFLKKSKKGDITANHLTLLAKNHTGYRNLIQLATKGYTEGFYYKPRIDIELLKQHHEGLICMSGCIFSALARGILARNFNVTGYMDIMGDIFGGNFYIEVQDHGMHEQALYKKVLLCQPLWPIVATNDVHYLRKEDAKAHEALLCIGTGTNIYDEKRLRFDTDQLYMKSHEEMKQLFPQEWLNRTLEIADKCNLEIPLHKQMHIHDPKESFNKLKEECDIHAKTMPMQYQERYRTELEAIQKTGYGEYLLVVADFIKYARSNGIPIGSGRGSSAGSLVCYILGITEIDPIRYGLLFERFINTERIEPPDIDVDISQARRGEVIEYIKNEYGEDRVSQIVAFGSMKTKAAIRDTCRALQLSYVLADKICKILPEPWEGNIDNVYNNRNIQAYLANELNDATQDLLFSIARKIEGRLRHSSTHAAGIVISDTPLINIVPLCKQKDTILTQYDMYTIEKLGLLKFDLLGLRTLDVINETCGYLKIYHNDIPLNDTYVYSQLRRGETFGVFQYEGWGYTRFIKRMQPEHFDHLIALGALFRPGTLDSGMADEYLRRMHGEYLSHLDGITDDTYGVLLYQEQVMQAVVKYAGFTMNEADILRKAIGKKDKELMEKMLIKIHDQNLKEKITTFARYGWNKAHAVSYALLSYKTAYLKFRYSTEFFCALLNSELGDNARLQRIIAEAVTYGVQISAPNINISIDKFKLHGNIIYGGLLALKGIGSKVCENILEERKNGPYINSNNLRTRIPAKKINSIQMKALVDSGVFNVTT